MTVYSHSRLSTFEDCPLKYKYAYIDKLDRDRRDSVEAFMGGLVHETMEKLYKDLNYAKLNAVEDLLAFFRARWEQGWTDEIIIVKKEYTAEHYRGVGERCIRDYYQRYHPFDQNRTLGIERRVAVTLPGDHRLQGFIDRLAQNREGVHEIHDYKTSGHLPGQPDVDQDRQLALYQIGVQQEFRDAKQVKLVWHYMAFDKTLTSERNREQLDALQHSTVEVIREIESAKEFPPRKSALCDWCEFQDICPLWKHPVKVQELAPQEFKKDSGVKLVNKLAKLKAEKQQIANSVKDQVEAIEARMTEVEAQLVALAKQEGLEVVQGSQHQVKVKLGTKWKIPGKNDPGREDLIRLLHQAGLWDTVSTIDAYELDARLKAGDVDKTTLKQIQQIAPLEETVRVTLSKAESKER